MIDYEDVGRHRAEPVDMALNPKPGSEARETFALAVSEMGTSRIVADEIPLPAAAFRLSGGPVGPAQDHDYAAHDLETLHRGLFMKITDGGGNLHPAVFLAAEELHT